MLSTRLFRSVIAVFLLLSLAFGMLACSAEPSEDAFKQAQLNAASEFSDQYTLYYGKLSAHDPNNTSAKVNLGVELSPELLSLLRSMTAESLEWVNDLGVSLEGNIKEDKMSIGLALSLGKEELVSASAFLDMAKGDAYLAIPLLAKEYLKTSMGEGADMEDLLGTMDIGYDDMLPDGKTLDALLAKYLTLVLDRIPAVTFEAGTLTANGVSQECTVYTVELSQKQAVALLLDVFKAAKDDEQLKTIICDFVDSSYASYSSASGEYDDIFSELDGYYDYEILTGEEVYAEFILELEKQIEAGEDMVENGEFTDALAIVWTSYVMDKNPEVIGTQFDFYEESGDCTRLFLGRAQNGKDTGVSSYLDYFGEKIFEIKGDLTEDGKLLSGTYEILMEEESMLFLDLANVDTNLLDKGYFNGSMSVSPSKGLLEEMGVDMDEMGIAIAALSLKIDVEQKNDDKAKATVSLMNNGSAYLSVTVDSTVGNGSTVKLPADADIVADASAWLMSLDLNALMEKLEASALPDSIVELIRSYVAME